MLFLILAKTKTLPEPKEESNAEPDDENEEAEGPEDAIEEEDVEGSAYAQGTPPPNTQTGNSGTTGTDANSQSGNVNAGAAEVTTNTGGSSHGSGQNTGPTSAPGVTPTSTASTDLQDIPSTIRPIIPAAMAKGNGVSNIPNEKVTQ